MVWFVLPERNVWISCPSFGIQPFGLELVPLRLILRQTYIGEWRRTSRERLPQMIATGRHNPTTTQQIGRTAFGPPVERLVAEPNLNWSSPR